LFFEKKNQKTNLIPEPKLATITNSMAKVYSSKVFNTLLP